MEFVNFDKLGIFDDYMSTFIENNITNSNKENIINVTNIISNILINQLRCFLIEKGYITKEFYAEIHNQNNKNYKNKFPWHVDSYGAITGEVVTFLYYYYITPNTKGGNLMIQEYQKYKWWFFEYKSYTEKTIDVWSEGHKDRFVFMEENLYHKAEEISSTEPFERIILTIFFQI